MLSQTTKKYKPIVIDSMYCFNDFQSRNIVRLMTERNQFKLELTASDSLYNDEVRQNIKLDSINKAKTYEVHFIDSLYNFQTENSIKLEKKLKRTRKIGVITFIFALLSIIII